MSQKWQVKTSRNIRKMTSERLVSVRLHLGLCTWKQHVIGLSSVKRSPPAFCEHYKYRLLEQNLNYPAESLTLSPISGVLHLNMHLSAFILVISAITGGYTAITGGYSIAKRTSEDGPCSNVVAGTSCNLFTTPDCCADSTTILTCEGCGDNCPNQQSNLGVWTLEACTDTGGCLSDSDGVAYSCNN